MKHFRRCATPRSSTVVHRCFTLNLKVILVFTLYNSHHLTFNWFELRTYQFIIVLFLFSSHVAISQSQYIVIHIVLLAMGGEGLTTPSEPCGSPYLPSSQSLGRTIVLGVSVTEVRPYVRPFEIQILSIQNFWHRLRCHQPFQFQPYEGFQTVAQVQVTSLPSGSQRNRTSCSCTCTDTPHRTPPTVFQRLDSKFDNSEGRESESILTRGGDRHKWYQVRVL